MSPVEYCEDDFERWAADWLNTQPNRTHVKGEEWARAAWVAAWEASRDNTLQQMAWEEGEY